MVVLGLVALPAVGVMLALRRDWRAGLGERLGRVPGSRPARPAIWIHGASVGEISAMAPLARALRAEYPDHRLVVSTLTPGGRTAAATRLPEADARFLFPLDLPWATARAIDAIAPRLVLFTETELWPNFLAALAARGIPAIMVSGRMSARAFARYQRWRALFAHALASVRWFCVQSRDTAARLVALGAPAERVIVTGSLKAGPADAASEAPTLARLGVADVPVLIAASTHAGEEEAILAAWTRIVAVAPHARLVLAPRRPERFDDVAALLRRSGQPFWRRSETPRDLTWPEATPILLLDTLGELSALYAGARAAFVGGTLVPRGGHNVLEPAAAGVPVVFGPSIETTRAGAERLRVAGGGIEVRDAADLAATLEALFTDPARAATMGARARAAVADDEGALAVTLAVIRGTIAGAAGADVAPVTGRARDAATPAAPASHAMTAAGADERAAASAVTKRMPERGT